MKLRLIAALTLFGSWSLSWADARADIELKVGRFFDPCIEASTSIGEARGEACIVQAIFNAFSAEDNGITVDLLPAHRENYYPQLITSYSSGTPPDVHILHRHRLADFASAGLLAPLDEDLSAAGIDVSDWEAAALDAVTIDDEILALPFDLHANLWHLNQSILSKAGLVGGDGRAIMPTSPGELLDHAARVKKATGKDYLAADFVQFPIGMRSILSLLWQQDRNILNGTEVEVDTAEMRAAISTFTDLFDRALADPNHDYESAQQAFLGGDVAVLINGTWAVDFYDNQVARGEIALVDYDVMDFPTLFGRPATWADFHIWAIPATLKTERPDIYAAALKLLSWINDHNLEWARTGHLAVRKSVLESEAYETLAHRIDYRGSVALAEDIPLMSGYDDIQSILEEHLPPIWREGKPIDDALAEAEEGIRTLLK